MILKDAHLVLQSLGDQKHESSQCINSSDAKNSKNSKNSTEEVNVFPNIGEGKIIKESQDLVGPEFKVGKRVWQQKLLINPLEKSISATLELIRGSQVWVSRETVVYSSDLKTPSPEGRLSLSNKTNRWYTADESNYGPPFSASALLGLLTPTANALIFSVTVSHPT